MFCNVQAQQIARKHLYVNSLQKNKVLKVNKFVFVQFQFVYVLSGL